MSFCFLTETIMAHRSLSHSVFYNFHITLLPQNRLIKAFKNRSVQKAYWMQLKFPGGLVSRQISFSKKLCSSYQQLKGIVSNPKGRLEKQVAEVFPEQIHVTGIHRKKCRIYLHAVEVYYRFQITAPIQERWNWWQQLFINVTTVINLCKILCRN